jgi:hypothetical protein
MFFSVTLIRVRCTKGGKVQKTTFIRMLHNLLLNKKEGPCDMFWQSCC